MKWIDVRHKYFNLDKNVWMNTLSESQLEEIWTPDLVFVNTKNSQRVNLKNESSVMAIEIIKGMYVFLETQHFQFDSEDKSFQMTVL